MLDLAIRRSIITISSKSSKRRGNGEAFLRSLDERGEILDVRGDVGLRILERRKKQEEEKEKEKKKKEKPLKIFKQGSDMIQCEHSDYCVEKELKKDMTEDRKSVV